MNRLIKTAAAIFLCMAAAVTQTGCASEFDATGYTKAVLALSFQGEISGAMEFMDGATEESLKRQYEVFIQTFVANNITNEMDAGELKTARFEDLSARIFKTMRYSVGSAKKTGKKEYTVPVTIQPSNVFQRFQERITADSLKIAEKVNSGGYTGTDEEVAAQVMQDIVNHSYELLEVSYMDAGYGKETKVNLKVAADEDKEYSIDASDMENLVIKILQLDEIQG